MKNPNDIIGNRTRDLPACSAVPQPTAPPRAPPYIAGHRHFLAIFIFYSYIYLYTPKITGQDKWDSH
jgi:hypothetical protein